MGCRGLDMVVPQSLVHPPPLSREPSQKCSQSLLSPWFPTILIVTGLVTEFFFYLSHPTWFRVSKLYRLLWCGPKPILPGEREVVSLCFCILLAPGQRGVMRTCSNSQFMATRSKKLAPRLAVFSWLPISDAWKLCHIWHTHTPLLLVTLGILGPHYPTWDSIPLRPLSILKPGTSPTVADF